MRIGWMSLLLTDGAFGDVEREMVAQDGEGGWLWRYERQRNDDRES